MISIMVQLQEQFQSLSFLVRENAQPSCFLFWHCCINRHYLNGQILRSRKHAFYKRLLFTIGRKDTVWKTDVFFFYHVIYSSTLIPLCFVVTWHFQVKVALILSCAVFILCSLPCFFFDTLMKSPTEDSKRRFSNFFNSFLNCSIPS